MSDERIVVESPLNTDTAAGIQRNYRYLLWALRELRLGGFDPIASHQGAPWYLDDKVPDERELGMQSEWFWQPGVPHYFFVDLGMSGGMNLAWDKCYELEIPRQRCALQNWEGFESGAWPPGTPGFELRPPIPPYCHPRIQEMVASGSITPLECDKYVEIAEPVPRDKPCEAFPDGAVVKWRAPSGQLFIGIVAARNVSLGKQGFVEFLDKRREQRLKVAAENLDFGTLDELDHGYERRRGAPHNAPVVTPAACAPDPEWRPLPGAAEPDKEATP